FSNPVRMNHAYNLLNLHSGRLERAFALATAVQPLLDRLRREGVPDWRDALRGGALTPEQAAEIEAAEAAVAGVLAVDDFVPQELTGRGR
ncbi:hypothetical protein FWT01_15990, partial [Bordetella pertussis]